MGTDELLEAIRRWAAANHPTRVPQRVTIRFSDGELVRLLVGTPADRPAARQRPPLTDVDQDVLEFLDLVREPWSHRPLRDELERQGKPHGLQAVLDSCRRLESLGYLRAVKGKGYEVPPARG